MTKIQTIIADDEALSRDVVRAYLRSYPQVEIIKECADGEDTIHQTNTLHPGILFLDVQMPEANGLEVVRQLQPPVPLVLFVTAYDQYALLAFDLNATDYLLKPFDRERFDQAMQKALGQLELLKAADFQQRIQVLVDDYQFLKQSFLNQGFGDKNSSFDKIIVKDRGKIVIIHVEDVECIEAEGDYVSIYTNNDKYLLHSTMKAMEKRLQNASFMRIHRSVLVNVNKIKELQAHFNSEYYIKLQNGRKVKSSRTYKENMTRFLNSRVNFREDL